MPETLALPLRIAPGASLAALDDASPAAIGQCVAVLLSTRVGERRAEPGYGSTGQLFAATTAVAIDRAAIAAWEPRASEALVEATIAAGVSA